MNRTARFAFSFFAALAFSAVSLVAATLERQLPQGLAYFRANELPTDLPAVEKALATHPRIVLDLRVLAADDENAAALRELLAQTPATPFVRLILLGEETSPAFLQRLERSPDGVITLAAENEHTKPDIVVATTAEADRLAYDAFGDGASLDRLLNCSAPQKIRYDEATLVRNHNNGLSRSTMVEDEPAAPVASNEPQPLAPPPNVDRVLLRAIHLHQALIALKKI